MIDNLLTELKGALRQDVKQKTGLEQDKADQAIELAGQSAKEVAEEEVSRGNIQGLMQLVGNKGGETHANPLVSKIGANFVGKLVSQLGLTPEVAKQVEGVVVPLMVRFVSQRFQEGGGMGALSSLMGGGLGGMLGGFFKK
ncbi:hypothetical protein [Cesiribacter andamanensis]|uniref:DUF937 domain-containing protein n=1 Tax=Cesiribacter andamanensis AMV16 TaxID=1279009 RepID=M7NSF6_9BACT|nr:hypothetical protein [Cesiribacter andamanensis]EMR04625.1 hypothetical protein ADICEAN_00227 [Cesiribacter andamanensis AMV16]